MKKITSIEEGLYLLEQVDSDLTPMYEFEDMEQKQYQALLHKLKDRKNIISQITEIKNEKGIKSTLLEKFQIIWQKNQEKINKLRIKREKIEQRLDQGKKTKNKIGKISY